MRKLLIGLGIFVVVLIALAIIVPLVIPAEVYRDRIVAAAESATGRQIRIDGPVKLTLLPNVAIEASGVALDNAPGGAAKQMATLGQLQVGVKLMPLISGRIEISRFVLIDPVIHLEVAKDGRPNWQFSSAKAGTPPAPGQPAPTPETAQRSQSLQQLKLGEVKLVNGTVDYFDARSNTRYAADQIGVTVNLPSLDEKSAIDGALTWRGKPIKLSVSIDKPRALMGQGTTPLKANVTSEPVSFSFDGSVAGGAALKADGALALDAPSVRNLANWAGTPVAIGGDGLGPLSFKGKLAYAGSTAALSDIALSLDAIKASGNLAVDTAGGAAAVKGRLNVGMLDLNPYLAQPAKAAVTAPAAPAQPAPPTAPVAGKQWSDAPIDLGALNGPAADLTIAADGVRYQKIEVGKSVIALTLQAGHLTVLLNELQLYGGSGKGRIAVDASGAVPALAFNFSLNNIQAEPLLSAAIDLDRVTGSGRIDFDVNTRGRSQREMIGGLAGKGSFALTNGAIKGADIAAMMKNAQQALLQAATGSGQQTAFGELTGTFMIGGGIVHNDDLTLKSPAGQIGGVGTVDLPQRAMDYRVESNVSVNHQDYAVPIQIKGPFTNLSYQPDVQGLVTKNAGKLLQGLTGKGNGSTKPADLLKGLFGK